MAQNVTSIRQALPRMQAILAQGGSFRLVVTGTSMLPFLRERTDAVFLSPVPEHIHKGDILFYLRTPESGILHRVHQVRSQEQFLVCGDAQTGLETVRREQILAVATRIQRGTREFPCSRPSLRLKVAAWQLLRRVRPYALAVLKRLGLCT